jgi:cytochrome c-type biogenesis protein
MLVTYLLIGVFIGLVATALTRLIVWSKILYVGLGLVSILLGLVLLGLFRLPLPNKTSFEKFSKKRTDLLGAFFLGFGFVFLEAPTCPACAPALMMISAYMVTQHQILYGLVLLLTYVAGQSVPILLIGFFAGFLKQFAERFHTWEEYIQIAGGILLIVVGLDLLWLA